MKFEVILKTGESGFIIAECPALPGCYSQGRTEDEALANIKDAISLSMDSRRDLGLPLPADNAAQRVHLVTVEVA